MDSVTAVRLGAVPAVHLFRMRRRLLDDRVGLMVGIERLREWLLSLSIRGCEMERMWKGENGEGSGGGMVEVMGMDGRL